MSEPTTTPTQPSNTVLLWLAENVVLSGSFLLAAFVSVDDLPRFLFQEQGLTHILVITLVVQIVMWLGMLYGSPASHSRSLLIIVLLRSFGVVFLLEALWSYLNPTREMPLAIMAYGTAVSLIALATWRTVFRFIEGRVSNPWRLLLVGDSPVLRQLAQRGQTDPLFRIAGMIHTDSGTTESGLFDQIDNNLDKLSPTHVVIAENLPYTRGLLSLQWSGLPVLNATEFYENALRRVPVGDLRPGDLLFSREFRLEVPPLLPRVVAGVLVVVCLPLAAILAVALMLSGGGPVIKRCARVGRCGKTFTLLQFHVPMEKESARPEPTALGQWMLRMGLHHIPELINIVRGEAAFFGPRPADPSFAKVLEKHLPSYRYRSVVRPGVMGWAQLNMDGSMLDASEEIAYDLYYIKHQSSMLDLYILGRSLAAIRSGA